MMNLDRLNEVAHAIGAKLRAARASARQDAIIVAVAHGQSEAEAAAARGETETHLAELATLLGELAATVDAVPAFDL